MKMWLHDLDKLQVLVFLTAQAIHDGMNCKQYQEQVKQESETNAEARRTKEMLEVRRYIFIFCFILCSSLVLHFQFLLFKII